MVNQIIKYSKNTHGQPNRNASNYAQRVDWTNPQNSSSVDGEVMPKGSATSYYRQTSAKVLLMGGTSLYDKPWTFAGNEFDINVPECARVTKVTFIVEMKITGNIKVDAPYGRFNFYGGTKSVASNIKNHTGWDSGVYFYNPNKKLSGSWQKIEYVMTGTEFYKRGYSINTLNEDRMGIDLRFFDSYSQGESHTISIKYIACKVEYELPNPTLTIRQATNQNNPLVVTAGKTFTVNADFQNKSNVDCCEGTKTIEITASEDVKLTSPSIQYNSETGKYEWDVTCWAWDVSPLALNVQSSIFGLYPINFYHPDIGSIDFWAYGVPPKHDVAESVNAYPQIIQQGVNSCIEFIAENVNTWDENVIFDVALANAHSYSGVVWTVDKNYTSSGVELVDSSDDMVEFSVPYNTVVDIKFKGCFIPRFTGADTVTIGIRDNPDVMGSQRYTSKTAPAIRVTNNPTSAYNDRSIMEIGINPAVYTLLHHRVTSSTEIGATVIDCGVKPYDRIMAIKDCKFKASYWEKIDYIGCVPLKYHHYDPDSTYSNKAISDAYKNKVYKGKEGVIDEKISLKFKARPKDTPTLQGLVKLDKPTPINANHKCFEGDPLNHRGWVVLSEIKIERTNPLWYDCEAEVDYITHDIGTKFEIFKGDTNNILMPELTADVLELGDNLAESLDYLDINTTGGFVYDDESEEGVRNIFSLDEGQTLSIKTKKPLTDVSKVRFDWYSNANPEKQENRINRVFRLRNSNGEIVLEYEYTNFQFFDDYVTCTVIVRVMNESGGFTPQVFIDVDLKTEMEADPIADDGEEEVTLEDEEEDEGDESEDEEEDEEEPYDPSYIAPTFNTQDYDITLIYGSSLEFNLNAGKVKITDAGYNGREVDVPEITLPIDSYTFETEWDNKNNDGTTEDIISYIDFELAETILDTQYSERYGDLVVSPFPIPYKRVVFTRESEEGTIFYLDGRQAPFKYLLEPYYQYHCGCDLVTREGTSIFDLNNSYTHYYIENGLVRLGFNKHNGRLYLAKWDVVSKEWITTHYFHMVNEPKFSVKHIDDDKIIIQAGTDTTFTIWRGHPWIGIYNPNDTIYIDSSFNYCYSDLVNGNREDFPMIFSFLNNTNLLPECVGGDKLDYDCVTIDDDEITPGTAHTITLDGISDVYAKTPTTLGVTLSPSTTDGEVHYLIDGVDIGSATSPFTLEHTFNEQGEHTIQAVYTGDEDDCIAISDVVTFVVETAPSTPGSETDDDTLPEGDWKLSIVSAPSKMTYRDKSEVVLQLTKGGRGVKGIVIELQMPDGTTETVYTKNDGKYTMVNDNTAYVPGNYQWGARFYDDWQIVEGKPVCNGKILYSALKWIKIEKATPTFSIDGVTRINKGKKLKINLSGVAGGLKDRKITYTINGGSRKTKTTNEYGNIRIPCNSKGTQKIKVLFAGSSRYNKKTDTFTVKVV